MIAVQKSNATIQQLPSPDDRLIIAAEFPSRTPEELYDYWTQPALFIQWWPQTAEVALFPGGSYHLAWPQQNWHLRGEYTLTWRGRMLAFTWRWDHTPDTPTRTVRVEFEPAGDGARLTVTHCTYTSSADDQTERQGHLAGWLYFLGRLRDVCAEH